MDLQKVAAQANAAATQRSEGAKEGTGMFTTPFADMIHLPSLISGEMFGLKSNPDQKAEAAPEEPKRVEKADNQRADNNDDNNRRVETREDAPDDEVRSDNRDNDQSDDNSHQSPEKNREAASDEHDRGDTGNEDTAQNVSANESDDDAPVETETAEVTDDSNGDSTFSTAPEQGKVDAASLEQSANAALGLEAATDTDFDQALDGLVSAAQATQTDTVVREGSVVKEAAQVLKASAAGPKAATTTDDGAALNTTGEQARQQLHQQQQQQTQVALDRIGGQAANNTAAAAAKAASEQSLNEQQAKALADTLKSDKPVKINVNVDNRAGVMTPQSGQSLNANAIAAQESANGQAQRSNAAQVNTADTPQQAAPQARVDSTTVAPGQAQALTQLSQGNANAAAESGIARATAQVGNTGPQAVHSGGAEGVNATAPGGSVNAQQTASAQRAQQAQTPQAPEQTRPLTQQISVNISKAISDGLDRISIQLRPDNLGRVEVKLEVSQNGRVNANIIVDRPETLELLRNDSRNLERALQDAGLDTQSGDLTFNLRDNQENPEDSQSGSRMADGDDGVEDGNLEAEMATRLLNGDIGDIISDMRVDIRA